MTFALLAGTAAMIGYESQTSTILFGGDTILFGGSTITFGE